MNGWMDVQVTDWWMDGLKDEWIEDISLMDRWANRYNTLGCSEAIGPKWAIVVGNKLQIKNDAEKILTASTVGPSLNCMSWAMF